MNSIYSFFESYLDPGSVSWLSPDPSQNCRVTSMVETDQDPDWGTWSDLDLFQNVKNLLLNVRQYKKH